MLLYSRVAPPKVPKRRSRAVLTHALSTEKKCDEARPRCSRCEEHGHECRYDPVKPRQRRRADQAAGLGQQPDLDDDDGAGDADDEQGSAGAGAGAGAGTPERAVRQPLSVTTTGLGLGLARQQHHLHQRRQRQHRQRQRQHQHQHQHGHAWEGARRPMLPPTRPTTTGRIAPTSGADDRDGFFRYSVLPLHRLWCILLDAFDGPLILPLDDGSISEQDGNASPSITNALTNFSVDASSPASSTSQSLAYVPPSPRFEFTAPAFYEFSRDAGRRNLIAHFCNTLSHLIVLREDEGNNPFQQLAVTGAIYALASAHLEVRGVDPGGAHASVRYHSQAIQGLARLIEQGDGVDKNELLAAIMLLIYYEVLVQRGRSNLVDGHLKGAMAIMGNAPPQNNPTGVFLERAFRFYDVIAALSFGTAPLSHCPSSGGFTPFAPLDSRGTTVAYDSVDALLGMATSLWPVIHRLSNLLALKNELTAAVAAGELSKAAVLRTEFDSTCAAIEIALQEWEPILPQDFQGSAARTATRPRTGSTATCRASSTARWRTATPRLCTSTAASTTARADTRWCNCTRTSA
ncbi:hypothetical protein ACCO45_004741 [Purpureocillium lilacinum]|uniref:Uncharacterized protein n=1 Tax=Purpureocillium lilacinum TaxID=33203 RepID=A0ACC4DVP2_PURLI